MLVKTPPKGMRDILPRDLALRQRIMDIIKEVYTSYGFTQIETPCVEDIKNLTSKQGGDNEKLIFKILKRGEKLENATADELCDLGLRYDLTVPLSRYYANNAGSLPNVFKAIQIGNVWRAERPQADSASLCSATSTLSARRAAWLRRNLFPPLPPLLANWGSAASP